MAKAEDPHRLIVYASNTGVQGRKRQPNLDLIAHNVYRGWYRGEPWDFEERALAVRYIAESGGGSVVSNHTDHTAARHVVDAFEPEEYRQELAEVHFQTVFRDHPQEVPLYLVWILRDFAIDKYKGRNTKGLLTGAGFEKDAYYLYRSFLRPDEPLVHITSKTRFLRSGRPDDGIKVYSNRPALTLYVNGVSQGERPNDSFNHRNGRRVANVFHWRTALHPGRNEVRVTDGAGHEDTAVVYYHAPPAPMPPGGDDTIERAALQQPAQPGVLHRAAGPGAVAVLLGVRRLRRQHLRPHPRRGGGRLLDQHATARSSGKPDGADVRAAEGRRRLRHDEPGLARVPRPAIPGATDERILLEGQRLAGGSVPAEPVGGEGGNAGAHPGGGTRLRGAGEGVTGHTSRLDNSPSDCDIIRGFPLTFGGV